MQAQEIEFGQWLPDQADYKNPGLVDAVNVYPGSGGYSKFETAVATASTTTETVEGARWFSRNDKTSIIVGGSSTRLFVREDPTVTETTGYTALADGSTWEFERFNDLVIAVSKENDPQYLADIDTDTSFVDLPGSPPKAAVVGKVSDWLVLGNLIDIAGLGSPDVPYRVRWSAFNSPTTNWVTDRGEQSDYRDLDRKYGEITGIVGGRTGLVFQERAIWRMVYVGAPKIFDFELISEDRGCISRSSIVRIGYQTYFLDRTGFYVTNGSDIQPIGDEKLNKWFEDNVSIGAIVLTHGAVSFPKRCIVWAFRKSNATTFTDQLVYSFVTGEWARADQTVDWLVQASSDGLNLGELAVLFPSGLGSMSAYEIGTLEWAGSQRRLGAFTASGSGSVLSEFSGAAAQADFVTGDLSLNPGSRSLVDGVMPIVELSSGTMTTTIETRATQGATATSSTATSPGVDGFCPHHTDGWFHAIRTTIAAGASWDKARGLWVRAKVTGKR